MTGRSRTLEVGVAVALDAALGEPPTAWHPVVWMGRLVDRLEVLLLPPAAPSARRSGTVAAAVGGMVVALVAALLRRLPWPLRSLVLWGLLSGRLLLIEVAAVENALGVGGIEAGRERVAWLVSRDTAGLDAGQVRSAAISTLAENTADAWVATLWWWSVAGLPGAAMHRWADTLDSRWGYLDEAWRARGWAAARTDDLLGWMPARLTALLWRGRLDAALRDEAVRTPSPNGGWPMGAAALAEDVRLDKPGSYMLHASGRVPDAEAVAEALRSARRVMGTAAVLAALAAVVRDAARDRAAATPDRVVRDLPTHDRAVGA